MITPKQICFASLLFLPLIGLQAQTIENGTKIYIQFGDATVGGSDSNGNYWNNLSGAHTDAALIDSENNTLTGVVLDVTNVVVGTAFNGSAPTPLYSPFEPGGEDLWYDLTAFSLNAFGGAAVDVLVFEGLDDSFIYDFVFYGDRGGTADSTATYTFSGLNSDSVTYDSRADGRSVETISGITPTALGAITVSVLNASSGNTHQYGGIGLMEVVAVTPPQPEGTVVLFR